MAKHALNQLVYFDLTTLAVAKRKAALWVERSFVAVKAKHSISIGEK